MIVTRLGKLRTEKGYTQIQMQQLTGIDQSDYSKLETGKRTTRWNSASASHSY